MQPGHFVLDWQLWTAPLLFLLGGLVAGVVVERALIAAVRRLLQNTPLALNDAIAARLKGIIFWLVFLGGLHLATFNMPYVTENSMEATRKVLFIIGMVLAFRLLANIAVGSLHFYMSHKAETQALPNTSIFENILRVIIYIVGLLVILQTLGVSVMPILTALGVGGLAISLALQDTLANIFAGINMIMARQIKVGDFIRLDAEHDGFVEDISWRNTTLRRLNNNVIIVPNSKLATSMIINTTLPQPEMSLVIDLGVSYDSDLDHVERVTVETAKEVLSASEGAIHDFEPFIRYHTLADSSINFSVILRVQQHTDQFLVKHVFIKRLHARYREEGIEIPFPQRVVHMDPQLITQAFGNGHTTAVKQPAKTEGDASS